MIRKTIKKVAVVVIGATMIGAALFTAGCNPTTTTYSQEELDLAISNAKVSAKSEGFIAGVDEGVKSVDITSDNVDVTSDNAKVIADALVPKEAEIERLNLILEDAQEVQEEVDAEGYDLDELDISADFSYVLTDRQIGLFDGKVEFDSELYDAEEKFVVGGAVLANKEDYVGNTYVNFNEGDISYLMVFEDSLDLEEVSDDEPLTFNLLGEEVDVVEWNEDEVTFSKGAEYFLAEKASVTVEGKVVTLLAVTESKVLVDVNGVSRMITEGNTAKVNGLEVEAKEVLGRNWADSSFATLRMGKDVLFTVEDGEEYAKNSPWEWDVSDYSLGLVLAEEFTDLNDDNYQPLGVDDTLCLPNNYVCVVSKGLVEEATEQYKFRLKEHSETQYVEVKGKFAKGLEEYNKVYVTSEGIYDEDYELIDASSVELDGSDGLTMALTEGGLVIDDITLGLDLTSVYVGEEDVSSFDEKYLTTYGIKINSPEDSVDNQDFIVVVPTEKLEATLTVLYKK
jgi:hypothetical protein